MTFSKLDLWFSKLDLHLMLAPIQISLHDVICFCSDVMYFCITPVSDFPQAPPTPSTSSFMYLLVSLSHGLSYLCVFKPLVFLLPSSPVRELTRDSVHPLSSLLLAPLPIEPFGLVPVLHQCPRHCAGPRCCPYAIVESCSASQ